LRWNINKHCDVDVEIDCAGYPTKKKQEKSTLQDAVLIGSFYLTSLTFGTLLLQLMLLTTTGKEKHYLCLFMRNCGLNGSADRLHVYTTGNLAKSRF